MIGDLVLRSQSGDVEAFAGLVRHFEKRVFHFVMKMTRQPQDAEDITQESFVKAWKNIRRFRTQFAFSTWLFTIARRTALNHLRRLKPTQELGDHDEPVHDDPASSSENREHAESIWQTARLLKPEQYDVLWLRYGEGFSIKDTARVMATNTIRVRVLLHRSRKRLEQLLVNRNLNPGGQS